MSRRSSLAAVVRFNILFALVHILGAGSAAAQGTVPVPVPGRNSNLASGPAEIDLSVTPPKIRGDFLLKQDNEGSCGKSARNPKNILCGGNDYGLVDVPGVDLDSVTRDAWGGYYQSADGGDTWESTMLPGHVLDPGASVLKGFRAVADITVRSGAAGLTYMSGIAFKSAQNQSIGFLATFLDLNNREDDRMPFKLLHITPFDSGPEYQFIDKPWSVTLAPTTTMCTLSVPRPDGTVLTQTIPDTPIVIGYSIFLGNQPNPELTRTKEMVVKVTNCGRTVGKPIMISQSNRINQGISLARSPLPGSRRIVATWRRGASISETEAILASVSNDDGATWSKAITVNDPICPFFQASTAFTARINTFPSVGIDHTGRIAVAWSDRGKDASGACQTMAPSRVVLSTSTDGGLTWTPPAVVDSQTNAGHQITPSLSYGAGTFLLMWKDLRETAAEYFDEYINEFPLLQAAADPAHPVPPPRPVKHHTIEVYSKMANAGAGGLEWGPSVRLTQYKMGKSPGETVETPKQWEIINLRLFARGKKVFDGDYLDAAIPPMLPPDPAAGRSTWTFDIGQGGDPVYYGVWTSNRDVRRVPQHTDLTGDQAVPWTPPALTGQSWSDPTQTRPACVPGQNDFTKTMDQNLYGARVSRGLFAFSPGNNKQVSTFQRAYVVTIRNDSPEAKLYRLVIPFDPPGVFASFSQFDPADKTREVRVAAGSTASRSVFIIPNPQSPPPVRPLVRVDVTEIGTDANASVYINSDPSAPEIEAPEIEAPEIEATEVYTPEIEAASINVFSYSAPEIEAPEIEAPEIEAPEIEAPEIEANSFQTPEIEAPEIEAPEIEAPEIEAPEIEAEAITDITWPLTNSGNTTAGYVVRPTVQGSLAGFDFQLVVSRIVLLPTAKDCQPAYATMNKVALNLPYANELVDPNAIIAPEDLENATIWIAPGETVLVTLRVRGAVPFDPVTHPTQLTVTQQAIDTELLEDGVTEPPSFTSNATPNVEFVDEPGTTTSGTVLTPPVTVLVQDNAGARLPGVSVTLSLAPGSPEGTSLAGTTTALTNADGIATFDNLIVNGLGPAFRLIASAPGALPDTSEPFAVLEGCATDGSAIVVHSIVEGPDVNSRPVVSRRADFDGDAYPDLVVIHENGTISKMAGTGLGTFERRFQFTFPYIEGPLTSPTDVAVGDFNEDGLDDFVVAFPVQDRIAVALSSPSSPGNYYTATPTSIPWGGGPRALVPADFNADGNLDVGITITAANSVSIAVGDGAGGLGTAGGGGTIADTFGPVALAAGHLDGDAILDVAVANLGSGTTPPDVKVLAGSLFFDDELPQVGSAIVGPNPVAVALADFDGDGILDVAVASRGSEDIDVPVPSDVRVFRNNGAGALAPYFQTILPGRAASLAVGDYNSDGLVDLAVANGANLLVLENNGDGGFGDPVVLTAGNQPVHVSPGDFNSDERDDLAITNRQPTGSFDTVSVLLGTCGATVADVAVTLADAPDPVDAGQPLTYTAVVTNNGPFPATGVSYGQAGGGAVTSAGSTAGTCSIEAGVRCTIGTLEPGHTATVTVQVTAPAATPATARAIVRSSALDPQPGNNAANASTTVNVGPQMFVVTTTADSGTGSLRDAINLANADITTNDTIRFAIPGADQTIRPTSSLPGFAGPVTVDGLGAAACGTVTVQIDGALAGFATHGLLVNTPGVVIKGLSITGFAQSGVFLAGGNSNLVECNYIGVTPAGAAAPNGDGVRISGSSINTVGPSNVISGNTDNGVAVLSGSGNIIRGNFIGTNPAGGAAVGNGGFGVLIATGSATTVGGAAPADRNVISGNTDGIGMIGEANNNIARGNYIGTDSIGVNAVPNGRGVVVSGIENAFIDNRIAFNTGTGAEVTGGIGTTLGNNRFDSNGGLGIDLGTAGVTANDASDVDSGANELQNFPVVDLAVSSGAATDVSGSVSSNDLSSIRITLYVSASCDPSGYGEGAQVLGEYLIPTGNGPFTVSTGATSPGQFITATAMSGNGSTSEFSACRLVTAAGSGTILGQVVDNVEVPLAGATIQAQNISTGLTRTAVTNVSGLYQMTDVPAGTYDVTASMVGYTPQTQRVALAPGATLGVGFMLLRP